MAIAWDPTLALGHEEIDAQHVELFARLDALLEGARGGRSMQEVGHLLEFLGQYVVSHFQAEEALMRKHAFPDLEAHRAEHARFVADFTALRDEYEADGASVLLILRVNARVTEWLRDHIYRSDKALGRHLAVQRGEIVF